MLQLAIILASAQAYIEYTLKPLSFNKYLQSKNQSSTGVVENYKSLFLISSFNIGTPEQQLELILGTDYSFLIIPSLNSSISDEFNSFALEKSSTYQSLSYTDIYDLGITGYISKDSFGKPGLLADSYEFILANASEFYYTDSRGFLGLNFKQYTYESQNFILALKDQQKINEALFSIDLSDYSLTIGGFNESKYSSLERIDLKLDSNLDNWALSLESISIDGSLISDYPSIIYISLEESFLLGPQRYIEAMLKKITNGLTQCSNENEYSCRCDEEYYKDFPDIEFIMSGKALKVSPKGYVNYKNNRCYFLIAPIVSQQYWSVGQCLLNEYMTVFNYERRMLSFFRFDSENSNLKYYLIALTLVVLGTIGLVVVMITKKKRINQMKESGSVPYERIR